ncbi:hypothetical protein DICVIV_03122 [Dictyocaulus viviparus]|uniref:Uncharacterized protein n=1 Tax=Dictyocaulus viviparus TaxID=29172 RepID=A0A0D8Y3E2_DICVI|nr:hypothetical protein DICVIV_03122 [Dictyocaulus viviparus]
MRRISKETSMLAVIFICNHFYIVFVILVIGRKAAAFIGNGKHTVKKNIVQFIKMNDLSSTAFLCSTTSAVSFTAGDSNLIDVYLNLGYVAFSLDSFPID